MFNPQVRKILWSRKWQPTPVFLLEKSHGQRGLEVYSPWGGKETDATELTRAVPLIECKCYQIWGESYRSPHCGSPFLARIQRRM